MTERQQVLQAVGLLGKDDRDGIAVGGGLESGMSSPR